MNKSAIRIMPVKVCRSAPSSDNGLTLVEVLISAFIVMLACAASASIYTATVQKMQRAMAEAESATLAEALRNYAQDHLNPGTYYSHEAPSLTNYAAYAPTTRTALVWRLVIDAPDSNNLRRTVLHMARDRDGDDRYDDTDMDDAGVATFVFYLGTEP